MRLFARIVFASALVACAPVYAASADKPASDTADHAHPATAEGDNGKKAEDPMICEKVQEIGSLLRKKKICMLKSEWDEQRRNDRANIERSQSQRGLKPAG